MPVIERGRGTLYYETYGSGRPLVFLHGMAGNTLAWWQQIAFFEKWYRCILVHQRGWGRSTGPLPEPWTDAFVPDLEAVLEELGVEEFAVVAQSMGGWTVDEFCRSNPGCVRAAVMTGTTGGYVPPGTEAVYQKARETAAGSDPCGARVVDPTRPLERGRTTNNPRWPGSTRCWSS